MNTDNQSILEHLREILTEEGRYALVALVTRGQLYKDELRNQINIVYRDANPNKYKQKGDLIKSRHKMDIHMARLEGAGFVDVRIAGTARLYTVSAIGKMLFQKDNEDEGGE